MLKDLVKFLYDFENPVSEYMQKLSKKLQKWQF